MKKYVALAALLACVPGTAIAQDTTNAKLSGVRAEARIGYETPTVSDSGSIYKIGSAVSYGGEIGFDLKAKNVTVGPYAVYEFSSVSLCDSTGCLKEDGNLGAGGRIGFILGDKTVLYAKVGYARIAFHGTGVLNGFDTHKDGVQGAIGVDVNLGKNVYLMVEGNYADYGKLFGTNLQRRHLAGGVGFRF
ncbi:MAG: porin family protein [Sphingomonas sp.]|uniref:outer membrane beta-barrel protein n=1 Tax=Sphingomonas sp. TaxID=28214 RepID=UPI001208E680|nr:outer membrane beta-barrel protein [Sphingomonas sp.]THD35898.1 MAG: porin family protein [Sphingomonas sp.]